MKKTILETGPFLKRPCYRLPILTTLLILISSLFFSVKGMEVQKKIKITVYYKEAKPTDTLLVNITRRYFLSADQKTYYKAMNENGAYVFEIPVDYDSGYWELRKLFFKMGSRNIPNLTKAFWWEAGDDITLRLSNKPSKAGIYSICKFSGKGATKYNTRFKADSLLTNPPAAIKEYHDPNYALSALSNIKVIELLNNTIEANKVNMSEGAAYLIKADILMGQAKGLFLNIQLHAKTNKISPGTKEGLNLLERAKQIFSLNGQFPIDSSKIYLSGNAISFLWYGLKTESFLIFGNTNTRWIYDQINLRYQNNLRDQIIAYWLQYERIDEKEAETIYNEALNSAKSNEALSQLKSVEHFYLKKYLKNYSLPNANGEMVNFNKFRNKIIFIDFWFTGCAGCSSLFSNVISKVEEHFAQDSSVVFVTVSTDRFKEKWLTGINSGLYTSNLAINLYTEGLGPNHPIIKDNKISYQPVAMLVDGTGAIRYFNTDNLYKQQDLIETIEKLRIEMH